MFSTLTCWFSGGWTPIPYPRASVSPGSITAGTRAACSLPVGPPSTDSGPLIAESRCGTLGKKSWLALLLATLKYGSASTGIPVGAYQLVGVKVIVAAHSWSETEVDPEPLRLASPSPPTCSVNDWLFAPRVKSAVVITSTSTYWY